jgi:hypothetical protein
MAAARRALRFHCGDDRVDLDSLLAHDRSRNPCRDFLAREVQKGAAFIFDSSARVAFLGGVRGAFLAPATPYRLVSRTLDGEEALIEKCIPQNIARWQPKRRNEVVFE